VSGKKRSAVQQSEKKRRKICLIGVESMGGIVPSSIGWPKKLSLLVGRKKK